ncbi:cbb3-type cytochrome c oxidase subunit I [Ignavibacterium album]|uniref:cbb3-type cytochrome c oxidase subunit I n=1 Tax=Ignavibacterium album TaxID=591197 RepID=UPI0035BA7D95
MFTTVRYFIKTSVIFLIVGILTGLYMSFSKYLLNIGYSQELISAHTHLILVGSVMMMIMGVALWFFPRADKEDKRYNPDLILISYWLMTIGTSLRFIFQVSANFVISEILKTLIALSSILQVVAMIFFFYSMWGRIRPVGSQYREAKGEKF